MNYMATKWPRLIAKWPGSELKHAFCLIFTLCHCAIQQPAVASVPQTSKRKPQWSTQRPPKSIKSRNACLKVIRYKWERELMKKDASISCFYVLNQRSLGVIKRSDKVICWPGLLNYTQFMAVSAQWRKIHTLYKNVQMKHRNAPLPPFRTYCQQNKQVFRTSCI